MGMESKNKKHIHTLLDVLGSDTPGAHACARSPQSPGATASYGERRNQRDRHRARPDARMRTESKSKNQVNTLLGVLCSDMTHAHACAHSPQGWTRQWWEIREQTVLERGTDHYNHEGSVAGTIRALS